MNKYFVGKEYQTIKEKNDILANYDELQISKLKFLNELYDNINTLKNSWSLYNNHVHPHELLLNKDAMFFDNTEVDELIANKFRYAYVTKNNIIQFIDTYKNWGVGRGDITGNSVQAMNRKSASKDLARVLINKVWGLGDFYNLLIDIETKSTLTNVLPFLLARYGITGKELIHARQLRWEDIDIDNKRVKIIDNGQLIRMIDVDARFLQWIDKFRTSTDEEGSEDYGYVLKKSSKAKNDSILENYNTINNRTYIVSRALEMPRISFGDLQKSRYIDLLLDIRSNRKLTNDDFTWVISNFKDDITPNVSSVLKNYYESLTKDTVIAKNRSGNVKTSLKDNDAKETVKRIRREINFEEFINGEDQFVVDKDGVIIEDSTIKEVSVDLELVEK